MDKQKLIHDIKDFVINYLKVKKGVNKQNEIIRLVYEILMKFNISLDELKKRKEVQTYLQLSQFNYHKLKSTLIKLRYPLTGSIQKIDERSVYLPVLKSLCEEKEYKLSLPYKPAHIYVEKAVINNDITNKVLSTYSDVKFEIIDRVKDFVKPRDDFYKTLGKENLFLVEQKYDIFKPCPCTKNVFSCNYYILNIGFGCIFDCSYCYLQHYTNSPGIILPVNIKWILKELSKILDRFKRKIRIGTGEFTDSLMLDNVIPYSVYLIEFFKTQKHILELKTKSINIENILKVKSKENIVISWSLSSDIIAKREELYAPSLKDRLLSARKVVEKGYKVGFHFDPIVYYEGWEKDYKETVEMMFDYVKDNILWISLGTLRFHRSLKPIIEMRYPDNFLLNGELFSDLVDKKMRYPEFLRIDIFKKMVKWIRSFSKDVIIYLCMEPNYIWEKVFSLKNSKPLRKNGINLLVSQ